jgi:hypothetical protein
VQVNTTPPFRNRTDMPVPSPTRVFSHSSHWGVFSVLRRGDGIEIVPHPAPPDPAAPEYADRLRGGLN